MRIARAPWPRSIEISPTKLTPAESSPIKSTTSFAAGPHLSTAPRTPMAASVSIAPLRRASRHGAQQPETATHDARSASRARSAAVTPSCAHRFASLIAASAALLAVARSDP